MSGDGNGAMAIGPKLPRPSSTLPSRKSGGHQRYFVLNDPGHLPDVEFGLLHWRTLIAGTGMRRREFIGLVGSATVWPMAVLAQQRIRILRLGVLWQGRKNQVSGAWEAFTDALQQLGWSDGNNLQIEQRWAANDAAQVHVLATELISLKPDIIFAINTLVVAALQHETKTIPIVFVSVTDPVASGFVASLSHPGGNMTGFSNFEPTLVGKHIEILKEIVPGMTAVSDMFNPDNNPAHLLSVYPILEAAARHYAVELDPAPVRNDADIERVISSLGDKPTTGLTIAGEPFFNARLDLITSLMTRYRVVSVCTFRLFVEGGCLISYGNDLIEQYRKAAEYIDRILKGASPADLPVQAPTKFEMVINLKTAKAMGLTMPPALLGRADEVIE
jgi:putative tryptophan/tyrosine transport system substrate-binding protein